MVKVGIHFAPNVLVITSVVTGQGVCLRAGCGVFAVINTFEIPRHSLGHMTAFCVVPLLMKEFHQCQFVSGARSADSPIGQCVSGFLVAVLPPFDDVGGGCRPAHVDVAVLTLAHFVDIIPPTFLAHAFGKDNGASLRLCLNGFSHADAVDVGCRQGSCLSVFPNKHFSHPILQFKSDAVGLQTTMFGHHSPMAVEPQTVVLLCTSVDGEQQRQKEQEGMLTHKFWFLCFSCRKGTALLGNLLTEISRLLRFLLLACGQSGWNFAPKVGKMPDRAEGYVQKQFPLAHIPHRFAELPYLKGAAPSGLSVCRMTMGLLSLGFSSKRSAMTGR